ncbi:hypothetical protein JYK14_24470 [Siccirubricoccus sp. KC 17139]|uniref:Uncharacterized protein n=1 Tax=Siccirubricoccus soli TaxID=2899147 RepID=A0ABT1DDJ5_9PROT|nr:hypothetical protein [Siccirubricoccus soli]MCO6419290.1 hypothetical protein [Siccirubricoccus soli]MCP2685425.1 hypothetical protein [Siccirubricoccus soli]
MKLLAEREVAKAEASGDKRMEAVLRFAAEQAIVENNLVPFRQLTMGMKRLPVTIDEFVESPDFLGGDPDFTIWPALREDLHLINRDVWVGEEPVHEAYLGGAIGTGKTVVGTVTNLFQLYQFSRFEKPQRLYGLSPSTIIMFPLQSVMGKVTDRVLYRSLRSMFSAMPFARRFMRWSNTKSR